MKPRKLAAGRLGATVWAPDVWGWQMRERKQYSIGW